MITKPNSRKNLRGIMTKGIVSIVFIYIILQKLDWYELGQVIVNTDVFFLLISFLLSPVMVLVSVWKWHVLLKAPNLSVPFRRLFALYYVGYMFNHILPTSVGGDVVVSYELAKDTERPFDSVASVLMNRFTGLMILLPAGLVAILLNASVFSDYRIALGMALIVVGTVVLLWFVCDNRPLGLLDKCLGSIKPVRKAIAKVRKLQEAFQVYKEKPGAIGAALGISVVSFLLIVLNVYVGCLAFSVRPLFFEVLVIVPFLQIVSMLPISLGGIGIREWAYMVAFPQIGIASTVGLSVILLLRVKSIVSGVIGGMLYPMLGKRRVDKYGEPRKEQIAEITGSKV